MQTVYVGNTLINDIMLGSQRMDDVFSFNTLKIDYLIVAGGGAGGSGGGKDGGGTLLPWGGGGGAGGLKSGTKSLQFGTSHSVTVGSGGLFGFNGGNSSFLSVTSTGGGKGGNANQAGSNGGSGGGPGAGNSTFGTGISGEGNDGVDSGNVLLGGAGGGAGGPAIKTPANVALPGSGSVWLDGVLYSKGGPSGLTEQPSEYGSGGAGRGDTNTAGNGNPGVGGIVKIRYEGSGSRATGGTISFSNGYTYHTFTTNGTFTVNQ